jgi:hypothetical protein
VKARITLTVWSPERLEQLLQRRVGRGVGVAPVGHRQLADLLDQLVGGLALLLADHSPRMRPSRRMSSISGRSLSAFLAVAVMGGGGGRARRLRYSRRKPHGSAMPALDIEANWHDEHALWL